MKRESKTSCEGGRPLTVFEADMFVFLVVRVLERIGGIDNVPRLCITVLLMDGYVIMRLLVAYGAACSFLGSGPLPSGHLPHPLALVLADVRDRASPLNSSSWKGGRSLDDDVAVVNSPKPE